MKSSKLNSISKSIEIKSKIGKILFSMSAIIFIQIVWQHAWKLTEWFNLQNNVLLNHFIKDVAVIIVVLLTLSIVIPIKDILQFMGLKKNPVKGLSVAVICVLPLYIVFSLLGSFNTDVTLAYIARKSLMPGFFEEFVWRAFMFGLLFRYAKIGFAGSILVPAVLFGSIHIYQGYDFASSAAAFAITMIGALYFAWMYVEWNFNLRVPIGLHILMNGAWVLFNLEGTEVAAGGLISNIMRVISIALAITLTICYKKRENLKVFNYPVWSPKS